MYVLKRDQLVNLMVTGCRIGLFLEQVFMEVAGGEK